MAKINPLIKKYGKQKRWVNFRIQERKGKKTKIPYSPITRKMASSTEASDWSDIETALKVSKSVGIVFHDRLLLGIDIDHCLKKGTNKITHEKSTEIAELIIEANSYTEISPSGEGLHIYLELSEPLSLTSNKKAPYEAYTEGRYFTFTGNSYKDVNDIRLVEHKEALRLLALIGYPWNVSSATPADVPERTDGVQNMQRSAEERALDGLTDTQIKRKMFVQKNIENTWNGDLAEFAKDASKADASLLSHLAFWSRKDAQQMERLWLSSPLGQREKTQQRVDYRNRSIAFAIKNCKAVYENKVIKMKEDFPELELLTCVVGKGEVIHLQNTENMCRILRSHVEFRGRFRFDAFKNCYEVEEKGVWRLLEDNDDVAIQTRISILFANYFGNVGKQMVHDAIIKVSKENEIDSAKDYFSSLKWDGEKRLETWLHHTCGVPNDVYHTAVAKNWIMGAVKRAMFPGCKFDYVLVLEGPQGTRKSTLFATLGGEWHVETTASTDNKDFFMQLQGKLIAEFSEGETLSRTEVKRMKAIITTQVDRYRAPYGRVTQDFPRRTIFAMTTNQDEYLKDETGNRRWLPVRLVKEKVDIDWMTANRDQLFAEAYHRAITLKEDLYVFPEEETLREQQSRRVTSPNQDLVLEWYYSKVSDSDKKEGITIDRVFKECLHGNFAARPMNKFEQMEIAMILKDFVGLTKRQSIYNGMRATRWFNMTGKKMIPADETEQEEFVRENGF